VAKKPSRRRLARAEIRPPDAAPGRSSRRLIAGLLIAAVVVIAVALTTLLYWKGGTPWSTTRGYPPSPVAFVDNESCATCHAQPYREWTGSHHDLAMQHAGPKSVLGDFNDARVTHFGVTSRFFKRDGRFFVNTEGSDGKPADFEIKYAFGVAPLQQYLVEFSGGRLQSLTIAWDTGKKRWFSLYPSEKIAHDDPLHWTGRYQNWNLMCAECHTTNLRKGYDGTADTYQTTWSGLNVGCQACHGPGGDHVAWARNGGKGGPGGLVVAFKATDPRYEVDACATCHSRRGRIAAGEHPGRPLYDTFRPEPLRAGLYHADGQQLDEVYEYGSFRQSKMYQRGVRCTDCHNPHSGKIRVEGNAVCVQCHRPEANPRFPTLVPKAYDTPAHHFHKAGSSGAQCVSCHMPAKDYMIVDPRRDHTLRPPRPDLSVKIGTPNACTGCHRDRTSEWAVAAVVKWYGPARPKGMDWALAVAAGRAGSRDGAPALIAVAGDRELPAIVRATALSLLRGYGPQGTAVMTAALRDDDPAVRVAAVGGLEVMPQPERLTTVAPALNDPVRAVRIEAARVLAGVPADRFDAAQRKVFDAAVAEFIEAQRAMADMPASHLNLAVLFAAQGKRDLAESEYLTALRMDPYFGPARANLVSLYNAMGRNADAERVLREGIKRTPNEGELYYSLGLLLAEEKRLGEAADALGHAARLLPKRARVRYNLALALEKLSRDPEAEAALLQAFQLDPRDADIVYATASFYIQRRQWTRALPYAERLVEILPSEAGPRQLLERIKQRQPS
jgi:predicted CXXCH cytochrome family protein